MYSEPDTTEVLLACHRSPMHAGLMPTSRSFDDLVAEGASVPTEGWDFSWFEGRATEERPTWGYARMLVDRLSVAHAALDIQTGGGEVWAEALSRARQRPRRLEATESWRPNAEIARRNLASYGASVAVAPDDGPLPFAGDAFDLVSSRHPVTVVWDEIARVLTRDGTYFSQQVGPGSNRELTDFMMGPQPVRKALAVPNWRSARRRPPGWWLSTSAPRRCGPSSTTSVPSSTSFARSSGPFPVHRRGVWRPVGRTP